ncbi:MAG: hypothetical protein JOZ22_06815 [Acidobacteriia bacterium]|nr:hypothetical protein [Terriglobia bacterium]
MANPLDQLVRKLQQAYGESLISVVLYGSAADGEHQPKYSDFNVLCVLDSITPRELAAGEELFHWWRGEGNPSPLLLTEPEIAASTDCFVIEFLDIQRQHRLLHGKDVISGLVIDRERGASLYRVQVERDLRARLLRLRQKAAGMMSDRDLLRRLLADSVSTFCVLFRHVLALRGVDVPPRKREIIRRAADCFGLDGQPFEQLLDLREERQTPRQVDPWKVLAPYLEGIGKAIAAVDGLQE